MPNSEVVSWRRRPRVILSIMIAVGAAYAPFQYTHQEPPLTDTYPDGSFDRTWLDDLLSTVDDFATTYSVPVAVNEFGVMRLTPLRANWL